MSLINYGSFCFMACYTQSNCWEYYVAVVIWHIGSILDWTTWLLFNQKQIMIFHGIRDDSIFEIEGNMLATNVKALGVFIQDPIFWLVYSWSNIEALRKKTVWYTLWLVGFYWFRKGLNSNWHLKFLIAVIIYKRFQEFIIQYIFPHSVGIIQNEQIFLSDILEILLGVSFIISIDLTYSKTLFCNGESHFNAHNPKSAASQLSLLIITAKAMFTGMCLYALQCFVLWWSSVTRFPTPLLCWKELHLLPYQRPLL